MRIIDAHNHPDWHGHDFSKVIKNMDDHGIEKTWLLSWESPPDECHPHYDGVVPSCLTNGGVGPIPFSRCLDYVTRAPDRFVLGYAPDPRRAGGLEKLKSAVEIYGVKVCGEIKLRMMYDNRDAIRMYRYCGEKGLPVTVHIDYEFDQPNQAPRSNYWYGGGIEAFERAIQQCPETTFLGHAPGFWAHISDDGQHDKVSYPKGIVVPGGKLPAMMRQYGNLYGDISAGSGLGALRRDPEFALRFLNEFQDRILFARDYFDGAHYAFLSQLGLSEAVQEKIFHANAERLIASGEEKRAQRVKTST
jgi:predicted TIM-barrel fold metal-dependent hydrolase